MKNQVQHIINSVYLQCWFWICFFDRFKTIFIFIIFILFYCRTFIDFKNFTGRKPIRWQWCWWHRYVGDLMIVIICRCKWQKKIYWLYFSHVDDIPIGHQHHNMPECDVGDWYLMFVPNSWCCWRDLLPTSQTCHQHIWSPTSVTNIDVTDYCTLMCHSLFWN